MTKQNTCGALIKQIHDELEKNANNTMRANGITMAQCGLLLCENDAENAEQNRNRFHCITAAYPATCLPPYELDIPIIFANILPLYELAACLSFLQWHSPPCERQASQCPCSMFF